MRASGLAFLLALVLSAPADGAATIQVLNGDGPNEGFNDPTPAVPVGGNPGTTIGQQRQFAFLNAAAIWGQTLTSTQVIRVVAFFNPLPCTATSAVLGAASPFVFYANAATAPGFPGLTPNTWYPGALAEKRTGRDIGAIVLPTQNFEIVAFFNSNLGNAGCLPGGGFYYGVDNAPPPGRINLLTTVLHELGHGLGFTVGPTNASTGARPAQLPSIWEGFMLDTTTGKTWLQMTNAERAASAINTNHLVWTGHSTADAVPEVLALAAELQLLGPPDATGVYTAQAADFGPQLDVGGLFGILMPAVDTGGASLLDGCEPFTDLPQKSVTGRIALVDRGTCSFVQKVLNAQAAGAIGVVIANNLATGLPSMVGADPNVTISSIGITQALGAALRALPELSNPGQGGVPAILQLNPTIRAGTTAGFPRLYAPNPFEGGSSVSHWDVSLHPNQLMEPFATPNLTLLVAPPRDLTFPLLVDIGW